MQRIEIYDIWSLYKPKIYQYIGEKTKRKSDIEDILQEVFIKFWTKHNEIRDKDKTLNWLISVSKNTIADYYRLKDNTILKSPLDPSTVTLDIETTNDESKKLIPIINSLPVKYKTVLLMSEIYGLPHKEIAEQFDLSISCVKTRVVRARKLLSEQMYKCCEFDYDKYGNIINCNEKPPYFDCLKENKKKFK
jgi:RNA polymerase sigma-70 factor, ECF subfamily